MTSWRLKKPADRSRAGQGPMPEGYTYIAGGRADVLPWGEVVEARKGCRYPFEFDQSEGKFLAHVDFLGRRKHMFDRVT